MEKTRKILMTECLGSVAILLLLALVFETGLVAEGLWATADGTTLFLAQTAMTIVLLATVPGALYLFRLRSVRDRLIADGETALRRWGSVRMLMICVPMVLDLLLYYLRGSGGLLLHGRHPPAHHHLRLSHQAALRPRVPRRRATGGGPYAGRSLPSRTTIAHT